jgi:sulfatase modifying factor 1
LGQDLLLQRTGYPLSMRFSAFPAATQHILLVVCISCCVSAVRSQSDNSKQSGIAYDKPASGHFVPVDGDSPVYMIPYVQELGDTGVVFEMVPVPGGKARIGSPATESGRNSDEGPQFEVQLEPYWVGKTEVTWAEYQCFMQMYEIFKRAARSGIRRVTSANYADAVTVPTPLYEPLHHEEYSPTPKHPAVTMTNYAAKQYTKWLSGVTGLQYRIPTEAEWEHAARAGSLAAYCFGDDIRDLDRFAVYSREDGAAVVGSKEPNRFGLHDMHGNVWEWTVEQHSSLGYQNQAGGFFLGHQSTQWPTSPSSICVRGGCWSDAPNQVRSSVRFASDKDAWSDIDPDFPNSPWWHTSDPSRMVGIRVVRSFKPLEADEIQRFWQPGVQEIEDDLNARLQEGRGILGLPSPEVLHELKLRKRN